ncbi:MAG TPA: endolytic transglycosylase MltG [Candidatus Dormibacteraeota bacterium]|nr:endolytic transglycosylase MltG [Candidatus Dormibacteraeota bacterium]
MKKLIAFVLLLAGLGVAGDQGYAWVNTQIHEPVSAVSQPVPFHIEPGEGTQQIAQELYAKSLIRNPDVFMFYLRFQDTGARLEAGDFVLNRNMTMPQIIAALGRARVTQVAVTLPEGATMQMMAQAAEKAGLGSAQAYLTAAQEPGWQPQYDFLQGRAANAPANLEGFLFPDTYELDRGATPRDLVKRQLDQFGQRLSPALRAQAGQATPVRPPETIFAMVTLASIVEREVTKDPDRAIVCGIFYNRLAKGMALQDDVTVLYGLGKLQGPLTDQDKQKDTPFNTFLHPGLPAGPISNPGLASINGCLNPQKTSYYYFFADTNRITRYAQTYAEFQQQQQRYGLAPD